MSDIDQQACPGGPLLVRGASTWTDGDGTVHPVTRPMVAVCRCTRSSLLPWCDGTHALLRDAAPPEGSPGTAA